jgi:phenol 2-monooxygenase
MNVSMMDSYNLAWKLAYSINGLTVASAVPGKPDAVVDTYHSERHTIAEELINFDKAFSSMFSGKIGAAKDGAEGLSHEQFLEVFSTGNGFTSGCGVEYPENLTVLKTFEGEYKDPITGTDFLSGTLRPGRRLLNVKLKRHADGYPRDLQDGMSRPGISITLFMVRQIDCLIFLPDFPSTGRFRILCLTSTDLLDPLGTSAQALSTIGSSLLPPFPQSLIEQVVVHPRLARSFEWKDLPVVLKQHSEMRFYSGYEIEDVYGIYGVDPAQGALAVVRPDGYVGVIARLDDLGRVERYLENCLRTA